MVDLDRQVCAADGVDLGTARNGRLLHLGALPKGVDPEHEPVPVTAAQYEASSLERGTLKDVCLDMLEHHAAIHPTSDCPFAARLREALREVSTGVNT